jgi:hypothetical protein
MQRVHAYVYALDRHLGPTTPSALRASGLSGAWRHNRGGLGTNLFGSSKAIIVGQNRALTSQRSSTANRSRARRNSSEGTGSVGNRAMLPILGPPTLSLFAIENELFAELIFVLRCSSKRVFHLAIPLKSLPLARVCAPCEAESSATHARAQAGTELRDGEMCVLVIVADRKGEMHQDMCESESNTTNLLPRDRPVHRAIPANLLGAYIQRCSGRTYQQPL